MKKFQVTISFELNEEFMLNIPPHRKYINDLINTGTIDYYSVSIEVQKSWMIINALSKLAVQKILKKSSLYVYWTYEINELYVFDGQTYRMPAFQMN